MTVPATDITSGPYSGNGLVDEYDYDFGIDNKTELKVYETDDSGTITELTVDTDYTVNIGDETGGTVTRLAGNLPTGYTWYIRSNFEPTQETAFASQGGFFPDVHEAAFDKATKLIQQLEDNSERSIRMTEYDDSGVDMTLASADDRAGTVLAFDETGAVIVGPDITSVETVAQNVADINTVADDLNGDDSIGTTAANIADVNTVADNIADVNTTVANMSDINTVADDLNEPVSEIETVAGSIANVNTVGNAIANVNTVATNIADVNTVADDISAVVNVSDAIDNGDLLTDVYQGASISDPTTRLDGSALQAGDIYFNTLNNIMRTYTGTEWINAASGLLSTETKALTSGQTEVTFASSILYASFYINGPDADNGRLALTEDYSVDVGTKTVTLVQSYPAGTYLSAVKNEIGEFETQTHNYPNITALRGAYITDGAIAIVRDYSTEGDGGGGTFRWDNSDLSTEVTADTQSGIYVAPSSDLTGSSGAWVRQHSGMLNVKWFGAAGDWNLTTDTGTDDTDAIQAAIDVAMATVSSAPASQDVQNAPYVYFPAGNYTLSSQITLTYGIHLKGDGQANIVVRHNGIGFLTPGTDAENHFYSRHHLLVERLRFTRGRNVTLLDAYTPSAIFQNGQDGGAPTYINSENGVHFVECNFDALTCDHVFVNKRGFNIVFDRCHFNSVYCESVLNLLTDTGDTPHWSYVVNVNSCGFTAILDLLTYIGTGTGNGGVAIRLEAGSLFVKGGLIQGCDGNAVWLEPSATPNTAHGQIQFDGVYWEANTGHHVFCDGKAANILFMGNWFVSGGRGNSFDLHSGTYMNFIGCATPNNGCTFNGAGIVYLDRCTYFSPVKDVSVVLYTPNYVFNTNGTGTISFANQLIAPAKQSIPAGGAYLVQLSHYDFAQGGAGGITNELFMIKVNAGGTGFTATSVARTVGGTNTVTFTWAYDAVNECLTVTPATVSGGAANGFTGQVISHNNGIYLPL